MDVDRRNGLASTAFGRLRKSIWNNRSLSLQLKIRLFHALILPIATYASETWVLTTKEENKLNVFEMSRVILVVSRRDRITNASIRKTTESERYIIDMIKTRRLKLFKHVCRKPTTSLVNQSYKQDFP